MIEKTPRKRSPNFPYISVKESIHYIKSLFNQVQTNRVPLIIAYNHMNLNPNSSTTDRIRAAMSSYGLIKEELSGNEKYIRLTELANRIIVETRENLKLEAIRKAALNDPLVKKIWGGEWKRGLPDERTMISVLQLDYDFNEHAAKRFSSVLKENYSYCDLANFYDDPDVQIENSKPQESVKINRDNLPNDNQVDRLENLVQYPIPLEDGRFAIISLPSSITMTDADFILDFIGLIIRRLQKTTDLKM